MNINKFRMNFREELEEVLCLSTTSMLFKTMPSTIDILNVWRWIPGCTSNPIQKHDHKIPFHEFKFTNDQLYSYSVLLQVSYLLKWITPKDYMLKFRNVANKYPVSLWTIALLKMICLEFMTLEGRALIQLLKSNCVALPHNRKLPLWKIFLLHISIFPKCCQWIHWNQWQKHILIKRLIQIYKPARHR